MLPTLPPSPSPHPHPHPMSPLCTPFYYLRFDAKLLNLLSSPSSVEGYVVAVHSELTSAGASTLKFEE